MIYQKHHAGTCLSFFTVQCIVVHSPVYVQGMSRAHTVCTTQCTVYSGVPSSGQQWTVQRTSRAHLVHSWNTAGHIWTQLAYCPNAHLEHSQPQLEYSWTHLAHSWHTAGYIWTTAGTQLDISGTQPKCTSGTQLDTSGAQFKCTSGVESSVHLVYSPRAHPTVQCTVQCMSSVHLYAYCIVQCMSSVHQCVQCIVYNSMYSVHLVYSPVSVQCIVYIKCIVQCTSSVQSIHCSVCPMSLCLSSPYSQNSMIGSYSHS